MLHTQGEGAHRTAEYVQRKMTDKLYAESKNETDGK